MIDPEATSPPEPSPAPKWQPLGAIDRRVAGVLIEKAKTTPSAYPLSLNAICTGCNQKSNRHPLMNVEPDAVEESLERLRNLGAVGLIQGQGRVYKYRHYLYEWLGVDKVELAVMAELLLRGPQTEGELRARAARMEPIPDLTALRGVVTALKGRGLILPLTPEGRGHVLTHGLYPPREWENLKAQFAAGGAGLMAPSDADDGGAEPAAPVAPASTRPAPPAAAAPGPSALDELRRKIEELQHQVAELRSDLDAATSANQRTEENLRRLREDLGAG